MKVDFGPSRGYFPSKNGPCRQLTHPGNHDRVRDRVLPRGTFGVFLDQPLPSRAQLGAEEFFGESDGA